MRLVLAAAAAVWVSLLAPSADAADRLADLFRRVDPSVVEIETTDRDPALLAGTGATSASGLGSGVLVTADGKVLTAAHVVHTADAIVVKFVDGTIVPARVLSSAPHADVAVVQLSRVPEGAVVADLGGAATVSTGDPVFVIGAPLGASHTLTAGRISARRTPPSAIAGLAPVEYFQTDAAINQGNSGGPMFDMDGRVIGIVSYILSRSGGSEGLGFAVTIDTARALVLEGPWIWSGVAFEPLDDDLARLLNVPPPYRGLLVRQVANGSLGKLLGLVGGSHRIEVEDRELILGGDVVLEIFGVALTSDDDLVVAGERMAELKDGDAITAVVLRGGSRVELRRTYRTDLLVPPAPGP